jgi:OOP family OmpA-OmpF porin
MTVRIGVIGYADPTGSEESNRELSSARAEHVAAELRERGVAADKLYARGAGVRPFALPSDCNPKVGETGCRPGDGRRHARSVILRVDLRAAGDD